MGRQLTFDLPVVPALGREDFMVAPANEQALALIEGWQSWPLHRLLLSAPAGAGKTHLAHVWAGMTGAKILNAATMGRDWQDEGPKVIEGIEAAITQADAAEALFHAINAAQSAGQPLLMTARSGFRSADCPLADLASRLDATQRARIDAPDDALLAAVLVKQFGDRQLLVSPSLINWLVPRMERSLSAVATLVRELDKAALAARAPLSRKLAASVLDKRGDVAS